MELNAFDVGVFVAFLAVVVGVSMFKSRRERTSEDYFLAGRGLTWPLIGLSIIAANISTEQFVGMSGQGAGSVGLAVSNWQLAGSIGIVLIAFTLLPRFLKAGIYTMPEYLEYRYNSTARALMALTTVVIYVVVLLTAVLYSGGFTLNKVFDISLTKSIWLIGSIAAIYTIWGGLKAIAWADLFQGGALLIGGIAIFFLGLHACGGWGQFSTTNADRLHMVLPPNHQDLPWTGVVSGMGIVILYYCGLNQFIVQRNLAAKTLREGQLGVIFAGALWLLIPFAIVIPGIMANTLYAEDLREAAKEGNDEALTQFDQLRASPGKNQLVVFKPDVEWTELNPAKAVEVARYNEAVESIAKESGQTPSQKMLVGRKPDAAFPTLIKKLVPSGLRGFMFAAIAGAVISSLASMLNSASTILTMDLYNRLLDRNAPQKRLLLLGRAATGVFIVAACLLAPRLNDPKFGGVFNYIQQFQGYIWPGVVAAFLFGMLVPQAPPSAGVAALICGPILYGLFQRFAPGLHFLIQVALAFELVLMIMGVITFFKPLESPRALPVREAIETTTAPAVKLAGGAVLAAVAVFYVIFW
ncbi:MAG TPA: sodium/solute symporter [Sedimentisphaerales bacterium]|jgi:SSS family solute:Na+ symporter|nr:sodium/solute symporter [Sedimentisphaerales bacterium]HNU29268.1 sodium/solute symporter [Sedimentisphaerales bacterium]